MTETIEPRLPDAGDLVWVDFGETRGREQSGPRPALVLTTARYHRISGMTLVCPISRNVGPWPFKMILPEGEPVVGAVLVDQARAVDRAMRGFRPIGRLSEASYQEVLAILAALTGLPLPP